MLKLEIQKKTRCYTFFRIVPSPDLKNFRSCQSNGWSIIKCLFGGFYPRERFFHIGIREDRIFQVRHQYFQQFVEAFRYFKAPISLEDQFFDRDLLEEKLFLEVIDKIVQ